MQHLARPARQAGLRTVATALVLAVVSVSPVRAQYASGSGGSEPLSPELQSARAALDKYRDPVMAVHDGYLSSVGCIAYPHGGGEGTMQYAKGGMGIHFINLHYVGQPLDPTKPQVLIYEPKGDKLQLAAAEWFVPVEAAGGQRPAIFGQELGGPMAGHHPLMPEGLHHYDLHVWLWKNNPAGLFSPTNPAVTCPKRGYSFAEAAPKMVEGHQHQ